VLARVALIVVALVAAACLLVTLRAIRLEGDARAVLPKPPAPLAPAAVAEADRLLRRAEKLNPDIRPLAVRGALLTGAGQHRAAVDVLREVVRREPDHAVAASLLRRNLLEFDPAAAEEVERHIRRIAPPVPDD
jgi:hypothetical protein